MNPLSLPTVRDALRRAILTLAAIPDRSRPQEFGNPLASRIVHSVEEAYGYTGAVVARFKPEPRDVSIYLEVLAWLTWYERHIDRQKALAFVAWATDVPIWRIGAQNRRGEDTIKRWLNDVVERICDRFSTEIEKLLLDNTPECGANNDIHTDNRICVPTAPLASSPAFMRCEDSVPTREAAHVEGSQGQRDRERTIRKLERNQRKWDRINSRRRASASGGS